MFRRILIANRGEVAARVLRTCRRMGIETVAVCSTADRDAAYLSEAEQVVCIDTGRPDASYLRGDRILQVALQTGCEALHPGWGFLSEQAPFAAMCEQAGISFVGPSAAVMRIMGEKAAARAARRAAAAKKAAAARAGKAAAARRAAAAAAKKARTLAGG